MELLETLAHSLESGLAILIEYIVLFLEYTGVFLLATNTIKNIFAYLGGKKEITMSLAKGYTVALEIMLGGEILRTITAKDMGQIFILGGIIVARVAITLLLHWEIKEEDELEGHSHEEKE